MWKLRQLKISAWCCCMCSKNCKYPFSVVSRVSVFRIENVSFDNFLESFLVENFTDFLQADVLVVPLLPFLWRWLNYWVRLLSASKEKTFKLTSSFFFLESLRESFLVNLETSWLPRLMHIVCVKPLTLRRQLCRSRGFFMHTELIHSLHPASCFSETNLSSYKHGQKLVRCGRRCLFILHLLDDNSRLYFGSQHKRKHPVINCSLLFPLRTMSDFRGN